MIMISITVLQKSKIKDIKQKNNIVRTSIKIINIVITWIKYLLIY